MKNTIPKFAYLSKIRFSYLTKLRLPLVALVLASCSLLSFTTPFYQNLEANNKFAQFLILDVASEEEYKDIERDIRTKDGVLKVKIDTKTAVLFCLFSPNAHIDETSFAHWLSMKGYSLSCYVEGVEGLDPVLSNEKFQCM